MENLNLLLKRLLEGNIDFVLIGGYAAVLHGSSQVTHDIDICAVMTDSELEKLKKALHDLDPKHRMNPGFQPSLEEHPAKGQVLKNFYLKTSAGVLDILERVEPVGDFERIKKSALTVTLFGHACRVIALEDLIRVKQTMTRPKDKSVLNDLLITQAKKT